MGAQANNTSNTGYTYIQDNMGGLINSADMQISTLQDHLQGSNYGYALAGTPTPIGTTTERFPFASSTTNASAVNTLTTGKRYTSGESYPFWAAFIIKGNSPPGTTTDTVERFLFASTTNSSVALGSLNTAALYSASCKSVNAGYAYNFSGYAPPTSIYNVIEVFAMGTALTEGDTGDLTQARSCINGGANSLEYGYAMGGTDASQATFYDIIDRWPFAVPSAATATDVGNLSVSRAGVGVSSYAYGYCAAGHVPPGTSVSDVIDRFPFAASSTNATDVGDLTTARRLTAGVSSTGYGHVVGGGTPTSSNVIDRWPFSSATTNASDVGDLTNARNGHGGTEY